MSQFEKTLYKILGGQSDANIHFAEMGKLLEHLGFAKRIKGGHHIFHKAGVDEILNLQSKGSHCKPYQVKQVRNLLHKYKLYS